MLQGQSAQGGESIRPGLDPNSNQKETPLREGDTLHLLNVFDEKGGKKTERESTWSLFDGADPKAKEHHWWRKEGL